MPEQKKEEEQTHVWSSCFGLRELYYMPIRIPAESYITIRNSIGQAWVDELYEFD